MSKYLNAQKLNRRVTFQRRSPGKDSFGQPLTTWVNVCSRWAHIKMITGAGFVGQEFQSGGTEVSRITASIRVRAGSPFIDAAMRCVSGGVIYEIRVVLPDEQDNRYLDIGVAEGANDG